ncbi:MAG: S41 family peptidase [Acidobacteriota bacterium]
MSRPWRSVAILLFTTTLLVAGFAGDRLLAVSSETQSQFRLYTELLHVAHDEYGAEVPYRDLVYASIDGMLRTLDPHTNFLSPEDYQEMRDRQQASFYGIGILVSVRGGQLTVISPIEGTPAWRMGLQAGDVISTIEGEPTDTMDVNDAVSRLKGPRGTKVNVTITRSGLDDPIQLAITRDEIPQTTVRYAYMMTPDVGYIRLTDFARSTSDEMRDALDDLTSQGMTKLLLDLRSNGGGLLDQTVTVSSFFVPEETRIVETRGRIGDSQQTFFADGTHTPLDMPVVVLVNGGTASAAEILAGAIQDHDVGIVVGTPTWGKGLVQTVYNLSYGSGLALTTAKYYTPSGRLIQRDYSSFYDYYGRFEDGGPVQDVAIEEPGELPIDDDPEEFATDLGRKVFGGGGITPDVVIELPDGPSMLASLFARNAFFRFSVDYEAEHAIESPDWQPPPTLLDDFSAWVVGEGIANPEPLARMLEDERARNYTLRQVHSDIFNAAFGQEAAHQILALGDDQLQAALDEFENAIELLERRRQLTRQASLGDG